MFIALCVCETAAFLLLLSLYRVSTKPDLLSFLQSFPGFIFLGAAITVVVSVGWILRTIHRCAPPNRKFLIMAMGMNILVLSLTFTAMELGLRMLSGPNNEAILGVVLYPKQWSRFLSQAKETAKKIAHEGSYNIHDPILGWTIAPSYNGRESREFSSTEGLRSPRPAMTFNDLHARHSGTSEYPASVRIALIGDSMTFGYEVQCQDSWAHELEGLLQPHAQVLNFGVSAYSLHQALLRYEKDVRPWHPQVVVIGISSQMLTRVNSLYPVLMNPEWTGFPFARPRPFAKNGIVSTMNHPVPTPEQILSSSQTRDLPHVNADEYYNPFQWPRGGIWQMLEWSYIFRFTNSVRPPSESLPSNSFSSAIGPLTKEATALSQIAVRQLVQTVLDDGSIPLVIHLPYLTEVKKSQELSNYGPLVPKILQAAGIEYIDITRCLIGTDPISAHYMPGGHYSPQAGSVIAQCLEPILQGNVRLPHLRSSLETAAAPK